MIHHTRNFGFRALLLPALLLGFLPASHAAGQGADQAGGTLQQSTAPTVETVAVISMPLHLVGRLPGELSAYQDVALYSKVAGYVTRIPVDRGSVVKRGDLLAQLDAPEIRARRKEADALARSAEAALAEGRAKATASGATYTRTAAAANTPGVISGNALEVVLRTMEADQAHVGVLKAQLSAAESAAQSMQELEGYLRVRAPFSGVITERNVHPGSFASPGHAQSQAPMMRIQQVSRLRLTVHVPEGDVAAIRPDAVLSFTVLAWPGEIFSGTVQRVAHSLEVSTRTMAIELDVDNEDRRLAPGMYAAVVWIKQRPEPSLFVPIAAVAVTTERIFVIRITNGMTEYVNVERGSVSGDLLEIFGDLQAGDQVAIRGTDELREGVSVSAVVAVR